MYTLRVPYKTFHDKPGNTTVHFNLTETEVIKLLPQFKQIFSWRDKMEGEERDLTPEEVLEFYNAFEEVLLASWGVPSEDGMHFRKAGRYEWEESAVFNATMVMMVTDPAQTMAFVDGIMPKNMENMVREANENLAKMESTTTDARQQAEIERLRARLAEAEAAKEIPPAE